MRPSSQFTGYLAADATGHKFEESGNHVTDFVLTINEDQGKDKAGNKKPQITEYHSCKLWNREGIVEHLTKGKQITVNGDWSYDQVPIENSEKSFKKYFLNVKKLDFGTNPKGTSEVESVSAESNEGN